MKFVRNLLVLFAVLQLASSLFGWDGDWGKAYAVGAGVGAAGGIIGGAIAEHEAAKTSPYYWEGKREERAQREEYREREHQRRMELERARYGRYY